MKKVVVDASVAIKWFVPEIHSEAAAHLLEIEIVLCAPDLIFPEFGNILWKKVRRGEISREEGDEILAAFSAIPLDIHPSSVLLAGAFDSPSNSIGASTTVCTWRSLLQSRASWSLRTGSSIPSSLRAA